MSPTLETLSDPAELRRYAADFYGPRYKSEHKDDPLSVQSFYSGLPKAGQTAVLSAEEIYTAVQGLKMVCLLICT